MYSSLTQVALALLVALASSTTAEPLSTDNQQALAQNDIGEAKTRPPDLDKYQLDESSRLLGAGGSSGYLERLLNDELVKRAAMRGFQGMRGKKAADDELYDKRAPMGFQGMRGKKSLEEVLDELEKRAMMSGFQGMRGKKADDYDDNLAWANKRAPMGFQGMRGKKAQMLLDELDKRAILGFHGMRGKKDLAFEEYPVDIESYMQEKRPMMMGFHGMRGKRSTNNLEKRSAYRYFDKKNPRWQLRGKFVGVRGKKWTRLHPSIYDELALLRARAQQH